MAAYDPLQTFAMFASLAHRISVRFSGCCLVYLELELRRDAALACFTDG